MRKSTAGILAVGAAFALTAAAAASISVTGPFDPAAGSDAATTCDIGDTTVDSLADGANLLGFTLATDNDTSGETGCADANIWLRVAYRDTHNSTLHYYASLPADVDYTTGTDLYLTDGDTHNPGDFTTDIAGTTDQPILPLAEETILDTTVLVMAGTPNNFAAPNCYQGLASPAYDDLAVVGPLNSLDNLAFYSSLDGSCSGALQSSSSSFWIVQAADAYAAVPLCQLRNSHLYEAGETHLADYWPSAPTTWYMCQKEV